MGKKPMHIRTPQLRSGVHSVRSVFSTMNCITAASYIEDDGSERREEVSEE